jgi:hypothetical protein
VSPQTSRTSPGIALPSRIFPVASRTRITESIGAKLFI